MISIEWERSEEQYDCTGAHMRAFSCQLAGFPSSASLHQSTIWTNKSLQILRVESFIKCPPHRQRKTSEAKMETQIWVGLQLSGEKSAADKLFSKYWSISWNGLQGYFLGRLDMTRAPLLWFNEPGERFLFHHWPLCSAIALPSSFCQELNTIGFKQIYQMLWVAL